MDVQTQSPLPQGPTPKQRRTKFAVGGSVIVVAILGLIGWAMARPGATNFYMTASEVLAQGATPGTEEVKVNGKVVPGSVGQDGLTTEFAVTDGSSVIEVTTDATLPDAFYTDRGEIEVIAQGRYDGERFSASNVFAKCPSKFKAKS